MALFNSDVRVHFIGIGGIGMSGIAEVLLSMGFAVQGSDASESGNTQKLASLGAQIHVGHAAENLGDSNVVVFSSAITEENPEMKAARARGIPQMRRAEMLAELMRLKHGIAIAGTHGKTTTTSLLATILEESQYEPTYIIGGIVENLRGHAKVGKGQLLVAEADESDGSFLLLNSIVSLITNIDNDHLNHYGSEENLLQAFSTFANNIPFYGRCFLNAHDERLVALAREMRKPYSFFGIKEKDSNLAHEQWDFMAVTKGPSLFDVYQKDNLLGTIRLPLIGEHNILNCLGAISIAVHLGVDFKKIAVAIEKFSGVGRRFQTLYAKDSFLVVDDYGHHPTEVAVTIKAARDHYPRKKIIVVFEPHRYSRTKDCWQQFLHCFNLADNLHLMPIYPASEKEIPGITSQVLVGDINRAHPQFAQEIGKDALAALLKSHQKEDAIVLCCGAGSIGKIAREAVREL